MKENRKPSRWWFHLAVLEYRAGNYDDAATWATDAMQTSNYRRWKWAASLRSRAWHKARIQFLNKQIGGAA